MDPASANYGEFGAACFGGELRVGERSDARPALKAVLKTFNVFEAEDLTAAHEVDDLAGGAVDRVHANEVGLFVDTDAVEAVIVGGFHQIERVVRVSEGPAFVVSEDGGDVYDLRRREMRALRCGLCSEGEDCESGGKKHGCNNAF